MSSAGCEGGEVASECAVELSCDEAFEAADGFLFGFALGEAAPEAAQCCFGGLDGIGEAVRVGPQPSAHGGGALKGPAGSERVREPGCEYDGWAT